jgi:transcriptional regulator with XRE-family HTH domain
MKDQISKIIETEGLTPAKFADKIGVQRSSISHILSGRNKPSYDFIVKVLDRFQGINAEWLMTGKGSMIKSSGYPAGSSIKQGSLFEQQLKTIDDKENSSKQEKITIEKTVSADQKLYLNENKSDEKPAVTDFKKSYVRQFTDVNNVKHIVIFYEDGTFEKYMPR